MARSKNVFKFKEFVIEQDRCEMKVNTDGILLGAWAKVAQVKNVLDIGTGTGLIALMLAQRNLVAKIDAVEIDEAAAQQAAENVCQSPFKKNVTVFNQSIQTFCQEKKVASYDLIVSNPPFFTGGVLSENLSRQQVRHTTKLSHQDLLKSVQQLLKPQGLFCLILPNIEGLRTIELAATYQLNLAAICRIKPRLDKGVNRLLIGLKKETISEKIRKEELTVYLSETGQERSEGFITLTKDFYL